VASSSQSCRIPYSSSGVLYSSGAASNFSPLAVRVPSLYPPVICPGGRRCNFPVESPLQKYFASPVGQIISTNSRHPVPLQGRIAIVTDAGWDAVDAAASGVKRDAGRVRLRIRERSNGALTNDVASVRRSRVVLTPRRWRQVRGCYVGPTGLRRNVSPRTTVANKPGHRGEREGNR
jgi:hypothetical protein